MRMLSFVSFLILSISGIAVAQFPQTTLEKVRQIRLLESTREDVKRILYDYEASDDDDHVQEFSKDNDVDIEIFYSSGTCTEDPDDDDASGMWKVKEWKAIRIEIDLTNSIKPEDIGFDLSKFTKEQRYANVPDSYIQHHKSLRAAFEGDEDGISRIILFPPMGSKKKLCSKSETAKKFYQVESWFGDSKLEDRGVIECNVANVVDLTLSTTEIGASSNKTISVATNATDPENDVLTYIYVVSGGQIHGRGEKVIWDLTAAAPGIYTITAGVDDGCGLCGKTMTKTVVVK